MFLISLQGKESIYEQIRSQIEKFIDAGILRPGDPLPSVRSLANDLGINPNTVMKAYRELENAGTIYTLNKKGVFVADRGRIRKENEEAVRLLNILKDSGLRKEEILEALDAVYKEETDA